MCCFSKDTPTSWLKWKKQSKNRERHFSFILVPWLIPSKLQQTSLPTIFYWQYICIPYFCNWKMKSKASGFECQGWGRKLYSLLLLVSISHLYLWKHIPMLTQKRLRFVVWYRVYISPGFAYELQTRKTEIFNLHAQENLTWTEII